MYLPLINNPEETFNISIFNTIYIFRQLWNENGFWTIDIKDANSNIIVSGIKLITQEFLLHQYPQITFDLISSVAADPGRYDLSFFQLEITDKNV